MHENRPVPIRVKRPHIVYRNQFVTINDDEVVFASGDVGTYTRVVEGDGSPGVAAVVTCGQELALVSVYRYPIQAWEWGVPRGFGSSTDPTVSITRELDEELGVVPLQLTQLGRMHANSGLLAGEVSLFHAVVSDTESRTRDPGEVEQVAWYPVQKVHAMIADGTITDSFTLAAMMLASVHRVFRGLET